MSRGFFGELLSKDIKKEEWYIASDGWRWCISASDYGYAITNYPGYETTYNTEDNDLGFEKNFEMAFEIFKEICKRNNWLYEREPEQDEETLDEVSDKESLPYETLKEITESLLPKEERQKLVEKYSTVSDSLEAKELTIQECIGRLETLFKNSSGSDYTYQLEISNSPFNILKQKVQEQEELLVYIARFIDNVEISDNGIYYVSFNNNTPYLDCIEIDKDHYNKFKKIKETQGE